MATKKSISKTKKAAAKKPVKKAPAKKVVKKAAPTKKVVKKVSKSEFCPHLIAVGGNCNPCGGIAK